MKKQMKWKRGIAIALPIIAACIAAAILIPSVLIPYINYCGALSLKDEGKFEEAIIEFEALDGYKDSKEQIEACKAGIKDNDYKNALALKNSGKYDEAIEVFEALGGYKDSEEQIDVCKTAINDIAYNKATELMNAGKYDEAIKAFEALDGYKDSAAQIEYIKTSPTYKDYMLKNAKEGDTVVFGTYEQDNDTSNGKEDIEWLVLDVKDGKALIISKYALDCHDYNFIYSFVTWETCTLRAWLNDTFLNNAFSSEEQKKITTVIVSADKNPNYSTDPGSDTTDKVFLLGITETEKYFTSDSAKQCSATAYAKARGANIADNGNCLWWLRSPGRDRLFAARVDDGGSVDYYGHSVHAYSDCVRPAMWISLE